MAHGLGGFDGFSLISFLIFLILMAHGLGGFDGFYLIFFDFSDFNGTRIGRILSDFFTFIIITKNRIRRKKNQRKSA